MDWGQIGAQVITALVMGLLPLLFPNKAASASPRFSDAQMRQLQPRLNRYNGIALSVIVVMAVGCIYFAIDFLQTFSRYVPSPRATADFIFIRQSDQWILPGFGLGLALCIYTVSPILKWLIGAEYEVLVQASNQQYNMDGGAILKWMFRFFLLIGLGSWLLLVDLYAGVRVKEEKLVVNTLWDWKEQSFALADVSSLCFHPYEVQRMQQVIEMGHYTLQFKDGTSWSTNELLRNESWKADQPIIGFISGKAGIPVDTLRLE